MNTRQLGLLAVILIAVVVTSDAYFATRQPQIIVNGGGQSYFQCLQPLNWLLCYPNPASNTTNICTAVNVGTSSCTLPQNGCDGVLRAYGRCEKGQVTVTINANGLTGSGTVTFPTAFSTAPTVADIQLLPASVLTAQLENTGTMFAGNTTWFNVPQNVWTELFGKTDWELNGNSYLGTNTVSLGIGCDNCTGFENFGLEYSSNHITWNKILNMTCTSIPSGGTNNSCLSAGVSAPNVQIGSWFRVTVNNQIGASESVVLTSVYIVQLLTINRSVAATASAPTLSTFSCTVNAEVKVGSNANYVVNWKVYIPAG